MHISKKDFYDAYPSLTEIKPKIKGKQRNLSTELYVLKNLIEHEYNPKERQKLYKIAKYIHDKRGEAKFGSLTRSFIYNLFHGRWGTSESFYNKIKDISDNDHSNVSTTTSYSSETSEESSETSEATLTSSSETPPSQDKNFILLKRLIDSLKKNDLHDVKEIVEEEGYHWGSYLKWLKNNEPESFSALFQQALNGDKADLKPFLKK